MIHYLTINLIYFNEIYMFVLLLLQELEHNKHSHSGLCISKGCGLTARRRPDILLSGTFCVRFSLFALESSQSVNMNDCLPMHDLDGHAACHGNDVPFTN